MGGEPQSNSGTEWESGTEQPEHRTRGTGRGNSCANSLKTRQKAPYGQDIPGTGRNPALNRILGCGSSKALPTRLRWSLKGKGEVKEQFGLFWHNVTYRDPSCHPQSSREGGPGRGDTQHPPRLLWSVVHPRVQPGSGPTNHPREIWETCEQPLLSPEADALQSDSIPIPGIPPFLEERRKRFCCSCSAPAELGLLRERETCS